MTSIKNILFFWIFTFFITPSFTFCFDPGQMQNIQQELEEANKAIEEYISSLPADEQAEFNRMVEDTVKMFDSMSEEEFESFLNEMFTEEPSAYSPEAYTPVHQPTPIETPALTSEQKKKVENVIKILNDIIRQTNIFLVQITSSLETEKNINSWAKKGSISYWQSGATWETLKIEIEKFVQQLYKIEDKDLTTQEYKYIADLISDEGTLNNLIQLQTNLNASVPQIEIAELDIKKLSNQAKTAIKNSLQHFTEALYMLQIPKALDALIEKYAPKAEKAREAEEAAEKRAGEAAKRQKTPIAATTAGVSAEGGGYGYEPSYGGYGDYGYDNYGGGYYGGGDYGGGYYGGGDYGGGFGESSGKGGGGGGRMGGGISGAGAGVGGGEGAAQNETKLTPVTTGTSAIQKNPMIKKLIKSIETSVEEIAKIIKEDDLFERLDKHIIGEESADPVNTDLANEIATVYKKLHDLMPEMETLNSMILKTSSATQEYYKRSFSASIEAAMITITNLKNAFTKIKFKDITPKMTPEKQWAYMNADDSVLNKVKKTEVSPSEIIQNLKESIKTRVSLADLSEEISKFSSEIDKMKVKDSSTIIPLIPTPPIIETPIIPSVPSSAE